MLAAVVAGEKEVWRSGTAPLGSPMSPLDAKPLEGRYKILLFPLGWEGECVSPEKQGQKSSCVLWGDYRLGDLREFMQTKCS